MQVGDILGNARRPIQRLDIGLELDRVTGDEARRQSLVTQNLARQPRHVATGALQKVQRLGRGLHPRFHTQGVAQIGIELLVEGDQIIDSRRFLIGDRADIVHQDVVVFLDLQIGRQLFLESGVIRKRKALGAGFQKEIERIEDLDFQHQIDRHLEGRCLFRKDDAGQPVAERILLPVDEMVCRLDLQGVGLHMRLGMRGGAETNDLGSETDRSIIAVIRNMMQRSQNTHRILP